MNGNDRKEFEEFQGLSGQLPEAIDKQLDETEKVISDDLNRSRKRFFSAFLLFSGLGYFCSLSVCSQNSIALTALSVDVAALLHQLPDPLCPIVCGVVFSIVPVVLLFLLLDRFQLRRLIVQYWWLPVVTTFVSCLLMSILPAAFQHQGMHHGHIGLRHTHGDYVWMFWWTLAAVVIPLLFTALAKQRMKSFLRPNAERS